MGLLMDNEMKIMWYMHTMEYHWALEKEILSFATTWVTPEGIMLSEVSQIQKDINQFHMVSLICGS